jgi:hypothetical protein
MPGTPVSSGETTAEPAMEAVSEPAMETVAEVVEMRKPSCHHDCGPEPEEPGFSGPIRVPLRAAWSRPKQTDLVPGKGQFR